MSSHSSGRFIWYELMTSDLERAQAFYADVLGWKNAPTGDPNHRLFTASDVPVAGLIALPEDAQRSGVMPHWTGYIGVDDVDAAATRVAELGGRVLVPPTDVEDISRFALVADPQMATFALVQPLKPSERLLPDISQIGHIGWHELFAVDWKQAFAFYAALFHWQHGETHNGAMGTYQQFAVADTPIGGMFNKPPTLPIPFWLYYVNVADIAAAASRVTRAGGEVIYGPTVVPGGARIVHCLDPLGAIFALLDRPSRKATGYSVSNAPQRAG